MNEDLLKVLDYFKKYPSVGVLRALKDLHTLYNIDPIDGMKLLNRLIEMRVLERKGSIYDGVLNYSFMYGNEGDSGIVTEFEASAVKKVVEIYEKKIIKWSNFEGERNECY